MRTQTYPKFPHLFCHVRGSYNISGIYLLTMFWNCLTIFLVSMDLIFVPASLGWPEVLGGTLSTYYQVTPGLWLMDIVMSIVFLRLRGSGREDYFQFFRVLASISLIGTHVPETLRETL